MSTGDGKKGTRLTFDAEASNLNLGVDTTRNLDISRGSITTEITTAVQSIPRPDVKLPPGLISTLVFLSPDFRLDEPIGQEFLCVHIG